MARFPQWSLALATAALGAVSAHAQTTLAIPTTGTPVARTPTPTGAVCQIYNLRELGDDANLCAWAAFTIPAVIEPQTWEACGKVSYYAAGQVLVVYHTPAVQAKVADFLKTLKQSLPGTGEPTTPRTAAFPGGVQQTRFDTEISPAPAVGPLPTYAVPAPKQQPKHLFHFIIRYEGEGIVDSNIVEALKIQAGQTVAAVANMPQAAYIQTPPQYVPPSGPNAPQLSFNGVPVSYSPYPLPGACSVPVGAVGTACNAVAGGAIGAAAGQFAGALPPAPTMNPRAVPLQPRMPRVDVSGPTAN